MGAASPYSARFVGLPSCGQAAQNGDATLALTDASDKYCGLVNLSNTCYVNSVLQALYYCVPFRNLAIRHLHEDGSAKESSKESASESLLTSLSELFTQIHSQRRAYTYITPRRFLNRLRKANDLFDTSEHQDAHEFMQFLLNDIAENLKKKVVRQRDKEREQRLKNQALAVVQPWNARCRSVARCGPKAAGASATNSSTTDVHRERGLAA
eukprot:TRINITY_DN22934_c0_g1_i3.p1 TRINITY_DN22934_c0_g1~~TRINITY_DN22934_c0_g1_i3.p1  ORF type:complete len:211 (+),score=30.11 TRINITY_DN22934_c0_g1_i3:122-754(+)